MDLKTSFVTISPRLHFSSLCLSFFLSLALLPYLLSFSLFPSLFSLYHLACFLALLLPALCRSVNLYSFDPLFVLPCFSSSPSFYLSLLLLSFLSFSLSLSSSPFPFPVINCGPPDEIVKGEVVFDSPDSSTLFGASFHYRCLEDPHSATPAPPDAIPTPLSAMPVPPDPIPTPADATPTPSSTTPADNSTYTTRPLSNSM